MYSTEILSLSRSRKDILDGAGAILTKAKAENRGLNDTERQEFDRRHAEGKTMLADIERLQAQAAEEERQKQLLPDSRQGGTGKLDGSPEERESLMILAWVSKTFMPEPPMGLKLSAKGLEIAAALESSALTIPGLNRTSHKARRSGISHALPDHP